MKIACAHAIAAVARTTAPDTVAAAYGVASVSYGPECIIPKPFDSRLAVELPIAVARAAMASGVATRPVEDFDAYRERLSEFVFRSGLTMKPIFERARARPCAWCSRTARKSACCAPWRCCWTSASPGRS